MLVLFATVGGFALGLPFVSLSVAGGSKLLGKSLLVGCEVGGGKIEVGRSRILNLIVTGRCGGWIGAVFEILAWLATLSCRLMSIRFLSRRLNGGLGR